MNRKGILAAIIAASLFGVSTTLNKLILRDIDPSLAGGLIYIVAGAMLLSIRKTKLGGWIRKLTAEKIRGIQPDKNHILKAKDTSLRKKDYFVLAGIILAGSVIAPALLMNGLSQTTATNASLLLNLESVFTALIAISLFRESANLKELGAILVIIVGAIFVTTSGDISITGLGAGLVGNIFVAGACLAWGIDNNLSKGLSRRDLMQVTGLKCLIGGSFLTLITLAFGATAKFTLTNISYLFAVGSLSIGFSLILFLYALREIGAMRTGVLFSTSSIAGVVAAFIILKEPITIIQVAFGLLMISGVALLSKFSSEKSHP